MSDIPTRDQLESHTVMQKVRCLDKKLDKAIEAGTVGIIYKAGEGIEITDDDIINNTDHDDLIAVQADVATKQNHLTTAQLNACNSGITSAKVSTYDGYSASKQDKLTAGTGITISNNIISATGGSAITSGYWKPVLSTSEVQNNDVVLVGLNPTINVPYPSNWQTMPSGNYTVTNSDETQTFWIILRISPDSVYYAPLTNIMDSRLLSFMNVGIKYSPEFTIEWQITGVNGAGMITQNANFTIDPSYNPIYKLVQ